MREEVGIIARAHALAANVFVGFRSVAEAFPLRRQVGTEGRSPWKVVGGDIDEDEERRCVSLAPDHVSRLAEIERIGLHVARRAHLLEIDEGLDPRAGLETPRAEEGAVGGIEAERLVAASAERVRQAALYAAGGDAGDIEHEAAIRARRKAGKHVVFGIPGRAAGRLDEQRARFAVEGPEVLAVPGRDFDAGRGRDVEARLIEQEDDVRRLARGPTWRARRQCAAIEDEQHRIRAIHGG